MQKSLCPREDASQRLNGKKNITSEKAEWSTDAITGI